MYSRSRRIPKDVLLIFDIDPFEMVEKAVVSVTPPPTITNARSSRKLHQRLTVVPFDPYPFGLSFLPRRSFIFGFEIAAFECHSLRLGREADSPRNITADYFVRNEL
jgi:hypothetical protein